uniref:Uncharacterized protein n=1 Tax=Anguilla anguilla TaxID=7936 RepID=A0A0E9SWV0_ANGAN
MGILRSSTIWELATLPPSWLPWIDSVSLDVKAGPSF